VVGGTGKLITVQSPFILFLYFDCKSGRTHLDREFNEFQEITLKPQMYHAELLARRSLQALSRVPARAAAIRPRRILLIHIHCLAKIGTHMNAFGQ